jgi:hypothetical protein
MFTRFAIFVSVVLSAGHFAHSAEPFDQTLAPLLAKRCLGCHNPSDANGGLDLTSSASTAKGGDSGAALTPGKPDESPLWQRIAADEMPPEHPLPADERELIRAWIEAGAVWGANEIDRFRYSSDLRAGYDWWSLQEVQRPIVPDAPGNWPRNEIDRFIQHGLSERGLAPSPEADRRTLIRRLSFDLLGLPPTPEDVAAFAQDASPDAYEKLVERYLASPQYGVRWARHWLDVVRFGESNGFEFDELRESAWPYRDWVVDALNQDLPYHEFARLQIAGDVLRPNDLDATIATGFLTAGAYDTVGQQQQSAAMRAVVRQDELEDLVGVVGQTFLGLTVQCARCHDHKFDPIRQTEYFQLVASLAGVRHGKRDLSSCVASGGRAEQFAAATTLRNAAAVKLESLTSPVRERLVAERAATPLELSPLRQWDFRGEAPDGIVLHGGAKCSSHGLELNGEDAFAATTPLDRELNAKSLEVWVRLTDHNQRGGGAISVQTLNGEAFDAIVYAELEPRRWMAGSEFFTRTKSFAAFDEEEAEDRAIYLCITYAEDGTIRAYRDGVPYGEGYAANGLRAFSANESQIVFGARHTPADAGKMLAGVIERAALYDRALRPDEVANSFNGAPTDDDIRKALSEDERTRYDALRVELIAIDTELSRLHPSNVYASTPKEPEPTHLLARGDPALPRELVSPRGVQSLASVEADWGLAADAPEAQRRERLARWATDPRNPLFARVMVNRVWHYHFGVGLVDTPNDFGFNGGRPTNQPLLDWLSAEFAERGYRLKDLHRLMVNSATYLQAWRHDAQATAVDAENRLLWRASPRRLEAEAARDAMLSVSGLLDDRIGGPGFADMKMSVAEGTAAHLYAPDDPTRPEFRRRTLYRIWARSGRSAMLDVLDCPDPSATSPRRAVTTTPLQGLSLLNNAFSLHVADEFAARLPHDAGDEPVAQVRRAYQLAFGRAPSDEELLAAAQVVREHGAAAFTRAILNSNEFLYVD